MGFLVWFLNNLQLELQKYRDSVSIDNKSEFGKNAYDRSWFFIFVTDLIKNTFQGELEITTTNLATQSYRLSAVTKKRVPFLFLGFDLPITPLITTSTDDNLDEDISSISQVPLSTLLEKYNGVKEQVRNYSVKFYFTDFYQYSKGHQYIY